MCGVDYKLPVYVLYRNLTLVSLRFKSRLMSLAKMTMTPGAQSFFEGDPRVGRDAEFQIEAEQAYHESQRNMFMTMHWMDFLVSEGIEDRGALDLGDLECGNALVHEEFLYQALHLFGISPTVLPRFNIDIGGFVFRENEVLSAGGRSVLTQEGYIRLRKYLEVRVPLESFRAAMVQIGIVSRSHLTRQEIAKAVADAAGTRLFG